VVVFRLPRDDSTDYIKRVIGLPGDRIQMIDGVLQINGQAVKKERAEDYVGTRTARRRSASSATRRRCRTAWSTTRSI
jgi:signal peptidase I